jgi:dihydroorotase
MPLMVHIDEPPPAIEEVLALLRAGDILTHAFRPAPNSPLTEDGRLLPGVMEARRRGVIFDIGHGQGSLSFATARGMLANGFLPDTISSDVHALCIDGPVYDLPTTMSKFLCLGMPFESVLAAVTTVPARVLNRPDLGTLHLGSVADVTILDVATGAFSYVDSVGEELRGKHRIDVRGVVVDGKLWQPESTDAVRKAF